MCYIELCASVMAEGVVREGKSLELIHDMVKVKCEGCIDSDNKAEAFCLQCAEFICGECSESHKVMKLFGSHEVVFLKQGRANEIAVKEAQEAPSKKCHIHEEPLIIYCFDCNTLICHHCSEEEHGEHKFEFSKISGPDTKRNLLDKLGPLKQVTANLSSAIKDTHIAKQKIQAWEDVVSNTIKKSFNELQQILDKRENDLLFEALKKMHDNKGMSTHTESISQIERGIEERDNSNLVEEADMGVDMRCTEALQQLCQTNASITQLADPAQCAVSGEGFKTAEVGKIAKVTLTVQLTSNKARCSAVVVGQLKSHHNGSVVECDVNQSGPGEYHIQYTPAVRGRHELTVLVDGQQVTGGPFPVFVSIHPTQLGKPVSIINGIAEPGGISTNSIEELIIAKQALGAIVFYKRGGKRTISRSQLMLQDYAFTSVPVDDEDYIYLTSYSSNRIMKLSKEGSSIVKQRSVNATGHLFAAVVGEEVMVCERRNKGTIMVYDRELNSVRKIAHTDMGQLRALAADSTGNIYAADWDKLRVHVFSHQGDHLRSFGCGKYGENVFKKPLGLCVAGEFVYVCDRSDHKVCVFTTEGELVTTLGQRGRKAGKFQVPCAVCVDADGFVCVCDKNNDRVQIF